MVAVQKPHETEPVQRRAVKEHLLVADPHETVALAFIVPDQLALADLQIGVSGLFHHIFSHLHMSHGTRHTDPEHAIRELAGGPGHGTARVAAGTARLPPLRNVMMVLVKTRSKAEIAR